MQVWISLILLFRITFSLNECQLFILKQKQLGGFHLKAENTQPFWLNVKGTYKGKAEFFLH